MGARKGQNNFKGFQEAKVKGKARLIASVLNSIPKGTIFVNENALIVYAAKMTGLHRTTIRRTPEYMKLLLEYFGAQPGAAGAVDDENANAAQLSIKLIAARIRIKRLEEDVARLKTISGYTHGQFLCQGLLEAETRVGNEERESPQRDLAFISTALTLQALLEWAVEKEIGIVMDRHTRQILDATEFGDKRIIVGPERAKYFFDWLTSSPTVRMHGLLTKRN